MRAPLVTSLLASVLVFALGGAARADQMYGVIGSDSFSIGSRDITSEVDYRGTETLTITRSGRYTRLRAHVEYVRSDGAVSTQAQGDFVVDVLPNGDVADSANRDPDYLTVLSQPFAAQLDQATLSGLRALRAPLPFDFTSPFTGSSLHGYLKHVADGELARRAVAGVRFEAGGPMRGALPDRPGLALIGTIAMQGTAYYDLQTALVLSLEATVTVSGYVSNHTGNDPVTIVYRRTIHAAQAADAAR
jgi:hypothetical protein